MNSYIHRTRRPVQYINGEVNAVHKKDYPELLRFVLAFPDTYELGMSHQGLKILYHILNNCRHVQAERLFAPEDDAETLMRRSGSALSSLESGRPVDQCQILGFTLQSELHYTTIINMLDLGRIPLSASERGARHPLVIGGGPQAYNPEPLADFFDAFVLGDGEEAVLDVVSAYRSWRAGGEGRRRLLSALALIPGVYVPSLYEATYAPDGRLLSVRPNSPDAPPVVRRRIVNDLDKCPYPTAPPVPFMETTHDRLTVEVARGCVRGCRFCHAGMVYRPYRERRAETVEDLIRRGLAATGYDEVSLSALSSGDYGCLVTLVRRMAGQLKPKKVSLSLPSIRPGSLPEDVIRDIGAVRKSGFTMAPEAAGDRLRRVINKGITEDEIMQTAAAVFRGGWKSLKLYFMIGLPTEKPEDVEAIVTLAKKIRRAGVEAGAKHAQVTVSISSFVPKAHTPFQWFAMAPMEKLQADVSELSKKCRQAGVGFKWHHPAMSAVEGLLSRGDRRLGRVILRVWRGGGRFEAWTDRFEFDRWREALLAENLDLAFYNLRPRDEDEVFPWDHLETGVSRSYLRREYLRGLEATETPPCRIGSCSACGACPETMPAPAKSAEAASEAEPSVPAVETERRFRLRLAFRKTGPMRYLSHLELFRAFLRAARRAELPIAYSGGFNPHPRLSFGPPLAVGAEGLAELVDVELAAPFPAAKAAEDLNRCLPPGLAVTNAAFLPQQAPAVFDSIQAARFQIDLPPELTLTKPEMDRRCRDLMARSSIPVVRRGGGQVKNKDVRPFLLAAEASESDGAVTLLITVNQTAEGSIRPAEIIDLLLPEAAAFDGEILLKRTGLYRLTGGRLVDAFQPRQIRPAANE